MACIVPLSTRKRERKPPNFAPVGDRFVYYFSFFLYHNAQHSSIMIQGPATYTGLVSRSKIRDLLFSLYCLAPDYISELVTLYIPRRNLHSAHGNLLVVPASRLKFFGGRRFVHATPTLRNTLPLEIRRA